ncbi:heme o synthase [Fervidibacillus halotolerans]|uniref:Protoheme IX farnesyltransferase n=1 Tax=Fervidibacillus halotolerans TaxID=2980027 RepID=A0A9E8M2H1_9BACI|nr:heme o synthase [Fervidibacillus halotolerans]WAA13912.1 heme o synthase [Fervidibacillus halotolerans]
MSDLTSIDHSEKKVSVFKDFLSLIKIGIIHSNMLTAFTGIVLALFYNGLSIQDYLLEILLALMGVWLVIAGSTTLNNYIDRDIDEHMERTKNRPTVTGSFSPTLILTIGFVFLAIGSLLLFQTSFSAGIIGVMGSFVYVVLYSLWTKRKYTLNTVVGSFSGAAPPLIGWAAIDPDLHFFAWVLFFIMFIWQPPHFLALAMKKVEEYRRVGIPMLPVVYGFPMTKRQILLWVISLFPLPFLLSALGPVFIGIATVLNITWLVAGLYKFNGKDGKWANRMFIFSLNYLTLLFLSIIFFSLMQIF